MSRVPATARRLHILILKCDIFRRSYHLFLNNVCCISHHCSRKAFAVQVNTWAAAAWAGFSPKRVIIGTGVGSESTLRLLVVGQQKENLVFIPRAATLQLDKV